MRFLILIMLVFTTTAAFAVKQYCGWLDNPTPSNVYFYDASGEIIISIQGMFTADGVENIPVSSENEKVNTNRNYGYSCVCMPLEFESKTSSITKKIEIEFGSKPRVVKRILPGGKQKLLKDCLEDTRIKFPTLAASNSGQ